MRIGQTSSAEIQSETHRLTGGFHLSEDQVAVARMRKWAGRTDSLKDLCVEGGLFRGPIFSRMYVEDPAHGVPYVSAKDLVRADVRPASYLSHRHGELLDRLRLDEGMILVTCSGMNLGEAIWVREDMDGLCGSHDLIRVCADERKVPPGYLYAFLKSRYGHAPIRRQIYGGNIKHIEPEHLALLGVPRLPAVEKIVHDLTAKAGVLRARAASKKAELQNHLIHEMGLSAVGRPGVLSFSTNIVSSSVMSRRFDASYHSTAAMRAIDAIASSRHPHHPIPTIVRRYFKPPMFKRIWVESEGEGAQFVSGSDVCRFQARVKRYVSFATKSFDEFIIKRGTVVFQAAGQLRGMFGRPFLVWGWLEDTFAADDLYRLEPKSVEDGAFLYAFLGTPHGQIAVKRQASGNSIPRVWDPHMRKVEIPWPPEGFRNAVAKSVIEQHQMREQARIHENEAVSLVERAIEEGS